MFVSITNNRLNGLNYSIYAKIMKSKQHILFKNKFSYTKETL